MIGRPILWMRGTLCAALMLLMGVAASAHEVRPAIATFDPTVTPPTLTWSVNAEALLTGIGAEHEDTDDAPQKDEYDALRLLPADELEARLRAVLPELTKAPGLRFGDDPASVSVRGIAVPPVGDTDVARDTTITFDVTVPEGATGFSWAWPGERGASVLRVTQPGGADVEGYFQPPGSATEVLPLAGGAERSAWETFKEMVAWGYIHIIPEGLDHILFVLGLFFLSTRWKPLLWQVTAFTIAHSITLAMGLYGVVNISPSIVEPLIALSIAYVGIENVVTKTLHAWRPLLVFAFGLLHGLGFAGILSEVGLPRDNYVSALVGFNVGVELGQLTVIAVAFLLVGWAMKKDWYRARIAIPASLLIAAAGLWWTVERTLLGS